MGIVIPVAPRKRNLFDSHGGSVTNQSQCRRFREIQIVIPSIDGNRMVGSYVVYVVPTMEKILGSRAKSDPNRRSAFEAHPLFLFTTTLSECRLSEPRKRVFRITIRISIRVRAYPLPQLNDFENKRINYVVLRAPRFEVYNVYHLPSRRTLFSGYRRLSPFHSFILWLNRISISYGIIHWGLSIASQWQ